MDQTNHNSFDKGVLENRTGYQFAVFADERTFNLQASMLEPKPAPRNLRTFLLAELAIENAVCEHASTARLANGSALKRSDVALIDAGGFFFAVRFGVCVHAMRCKWHLFPSGSMWA